MRRQLCDRKLYEEHNMSRTYRRKSGDHTDLEWQTREMIRVPGYYIWHWVPMDPKTKQYKKVVNKYHSDAGTQKFHNCPSGWWVNMVMQRPHRRDAKRQLKKWMTDPEYEVILNAKEPLPYWD